MIGLLIRRFNAWALDRYNRKLKKEGKKKVARLHGSKKTYLFLKHAEKVFERADKAKASLASKDRQRGRREGSTWDGIVERLGSASSKASAKEIEAKLEKFTISLDTPPTEYKAELPVGVEKTARIMGAVYLRILTKTNNMENFVNAEIAARNIKVSKKQLDSLTIAEKRKLLRVDELKERHAEELKEKDIQSIVPQSKELKEILTNGKQAEILDRELGILPLLNEE